jgi:lauroyl/myristoyl acyltransferase
VRRALKPQWLDRLVTHRLNQAGFSVFPKRGSLDAMLARLKQGDVIVFPYDQHAQPPDGIEVDFFGHPAWTCKSLATIARRRAGVASGRLAGTWRPARAALRRCTAAHRVREYERGDPAQHARL